MTSPYYTPTGNPPAQSRGTSPTIRAEYALIDAGFQKLPTPGQVWGGATNYVNDTGTANAYVVTLNALVTTLTAGLEVSFKSTHANTGASTLTITGVGTAAIVGPDGVTPLSANAITAGMIVDVRYDGANFQFRSGMLAGTQSPSAIQSQAYVSGTTAGTGSAYTLSVTPALATYSGVPGFFVNFHITCSAAPTFNVNGLGALNLVKMKSDGTFANLAAADVQTGHRAFVVVISGSQALVINFSAQGRLIGARIIVSTQSYTATTGTTFVDVTLVGGGAAGGGAAATGAGQIAVGSGGGSGGNARSLLTSGFNGVTITIGAAGVAALGAVGGNGGTTSFGALLSATGGSGGQLGSAVAVGTVAAAPGGSGGTGSGGNLLALNGQPGGSSLYADTAGLSGYGAPSIFGGGAPSVSGLSSGVTAVSFGSGGSGASVTPSNGTGIGGNGAIGAAILLEYA